MEIKILPKSVQDLLRTGTTIKSASHCTTQLVLNSLDAKSTSIAIRVNLITHHIQVIDNGKGISKHNFELIGQRYATSKYLSTKELMANPCIFGQRGEALASIIKISKTVKITSKTADSAETYLKTFENGKSLGISDTSERASKGTTVLIEDFMYNLPVRKTHMKTSNCIEEIKTEIEAISLIHPNISFSLRHDPSGEIIFQTFKTKFVFQTVTHLYGNEFTKQLRKIHFTNDKLKITGMISVVGYGHKRIQLVYVNKRHLKKSKIHSLINSLIGRSKILKNNSSPTLKHKYGVYIINLKCSRSEYDVVDFNNILIEFRNWDEILGCIEQVVKQFLEKENLLEKPKETKVNNFQVGTPAWQMPIQVRTSQYDGVIRGVSVKRKPAEEISESTLSVIAIEDSDNGTARKEKEDNGTMPQKKKSKITTNEVKEKLLIEENLESKNDKYDNEKEIVQEIIAKPQEQKKMKNYNSLKVETHTNTKENYFCNDRVLRSLECAQDIILDMFLKSTALFKADEELKEEFAKNNEENVDEPAAVIANSNKQSNNEYSFNSVKLHNNIPNLDDHGNSEQISGKQISNLDKDNLKPLSKKDVSNLDDQINVNTHSNQINSKQELKNQTTNLIVQDNFTEISKNQIINLNNPTKPVQVSKAIQVSASKIPELNWNPNFIKKYPFQLCNKRNPPSEHPIVLKTKLHTNSDLNLNQNITRCEKPRYQFNRKQHSNLKQILEKRRLDNELLEKPGLINGRDNKFKLNYKVKKGLTYKNIFKNNKRNDQTRHFTRKPLQEKMYVRTSYGNYKRIKHDAEKYKIPIRTRFNFQLTSSSTFAHRDLTSLKYSNYSCTVRRTKKFIHSSNFIKPAMDDKEKRFENKQTKFSLNPREILHANSMMKTWFDLKKKSNKFLQNFRDNKCLFGRKFSPKKDQTFKKNNVPYIRPGFTEVNNFRRNILKPNDGFKPMKENNFVPYLNVQKKICYFENDNRQNKVNKILEPNHVDLKNYFKKPKSPQSGYIPCSKNVNEPNILYNNITVSESLDITFPTILPENEGTLSVCENQNMPEIIDILAPRNCESISEINDRNWDTSFQYLHTKYINYSSCENLPKSPGLLSNKEMENNYRFQEMNPQDIPQASDDAYIPFRTNPHLNEKTEHVNSTIPSHDYTNMNKYSAENKQDIPIYLQCQDNEIFNRFLTDNTNNNTSDIQPQNLERFNKSSTEKTKQLKSYLQPEHYEKPLNMQERKRTFLNERLAYPSSNLQGPEKCLNTLAENTESFNITFSPKSCTLTDVSMDKNSYNSHELSKIQKRKSNFKGSVMETPVSKMGQYISSYNISSSKSVDIINKLPSGKNLPSTITNRSLCIAPNNNEQISTNNLNMDVPTKKLSKNLSLCSNYKAKQDLNNIFCSKDMSKHVSPDVIEVPSKKFNGTELNLNNKNSEDIHIVSSTKEATNNNYNSDTDSYSVVDLISCCSMKLNEGSDKLKHCNINTNGGQDLNRIDVLSNSRRSPEKQPHIIIADTKLNRHSETSKTITSTHSNRNVEQNASKFDTKNVEISTVNLQNNTNNVKNKSAIEEILIDFASLYNSDSEKNVKNQYSNSDKNNVEATKIQFDVAKNTSVAESVLMDLHNIMSSADSENNLNIHTLHPKKNNSQISTEYLKFSYEPVDIAKNNMDAKDNPDDFDITFDFDPDLNLSDPKHISFEENEVCKSSMNIENCLDNVDSKKDEKMSNKTIKVLNCEDKSNIENVTSSVLTNTVPDSNENEIKIGKSSTITNNDNDINSHKHESLKLESVKNSTSDDTSLLPMTENLKTSKNTRSFPRPSFLPKGMSPILYSVSTAPIKKLSPTSKKKLHQIMAKSNYDDLQTVKWMNYFQTKDGKTFFSDLYTDKKNYEKAIPNLNVKMLPKKVMDGLNNFTFSKECFDRLTVISQWDNKFIVTKLLIGGNQNKLVLFDQHAVHERIRLENLLKEYKANENSNLKSIKCNAKIKLKLDEIDIRMLKNYKLNFESWGLFYNIKDKRTAIFTKIPICWESKDECINADSTNIKSLIKDLIAEMSNWLRNTGKINIVIPHVILNSIKMEACRGAVKFGDALTKEKCEEYLTQLSFCDLPFQCAHGRPTLVPIYNLNELNTSIKTRKVCWDKLRIGINKHT